MLKQISRAVCAVLIAVPLSLAVFGQTAPNTRPNWMDNDWRRAKYPLDKYCVGYAPAPATDANLAKSSEQAENNALKALIRQLDVKLSGSSSGKSKSLTVDNKEKLTEDFVSTMSSEMKAQVSGLVVEPPYYDKANKTVYVFAWVEKAELAKFCVSQAEDRIGRAGDVLNGLKRLTARGAKPDDVFNESEKGVMVLDECDNTYLDLLRLVSPGHAKLRDLSARSYKTRGDIKEVLDTYKALPSIAVSVSGALGATDREILKGFMGEALKRSRIYLPVSGETQEANAAFICDMKVDRTNDNGVRSIRAQIVERSAGTPEGKLVFANIKGVKGVKDAQCDPDSLQRAVDYIAEKMGFGRKGAAGTFKDTRDGKTYRTATIGGQVWMAQNLNYAKDGRCYGDDPKNCEKWGRLYSWDIAMEACPAGWHLPRDEEWETLLIYADGKEAAGGKLKAKSGWNSKGNGTDAYGFAALPGGLGNGGGFNYAGSAGYWWSAAEYGDNAWFRGMGYDKETVGRRNAVKSSLSSVRCLEDNDEYRAMAKKKAEADEAVNRGNAHYNKGEYANAIKEYEAALKIVPGHDLAARNLKMAVYGQRRKEARVRAEKLKAAKITKFRDSRDGKTYGKIAIGKQVWMAENLNYAEGGKYHDNDPENARYGRLYDWDAAMEACPAGWHLPDDEEWEKLMIAANGKETAGTKLKAVDGWAYRYDEDGDRIDVTDGTDEYGFSAMPGGWGDGDGNFGGRGHNAYWWSATEKCWVMHSDSVDMKTDGYGNSHLFSVRCLEDSEEKRKADEEYRNRYKISDCMYVDVGNKEKYKAHAANGDKFVNAGKYANAVMEYNSAKRLEKLSPDYSSGSSPMDYRIEIAKRQAELAEQQAELAKRRAEKQAVTKKYDGHVATGDGYLGKGEYAKAITEYEKAKEYESQEDIDREIASKEGEIESKKDEIKMSRDTKSEDGCEPIKSLGVLGIVSGQIKGKSVASADIFGKGGFATDIDAILSGVGGLKSGGRCWLTPLEERINRAVDAPKEKSAERETKGDAFMAIKQYAKAITEYQEAKELIAIHKSLESHRVVLNDCRGKKGVAGLGYGKGVAGLGYGSGYGSGFGGGGGCNCKTASSLDEKIDLATYEQYVASGNVRMAKRLYGEAIAEYEKAKTWAGKYCAASSWNDKMCSAYTTTGDDYMARKDYARAITEYEKALKFENVSDYSCSGGGVGDLMGGLMGGGGRDKTPLENKILDAYIKSGDDNMAKREFAKAVTDYENALKTEAIGKGQGLNLQRNPPPLTPLETKLEEAKEAADPNYRRRGQLNITSPDFIKGAPLTGGRSRASIQRTVMANMPPLRDAYALRCRNKPGLAGRVTVKFAIDEFGNVTFAQVVESTMNDPEFERTVVARVKIWKFDKIDKPGDETEVTYPFAFAQ